MSTLLQSIQSDTLRVGQSPRENDSLRSFYPWKGLAPGGMGHETAT